MLCKSLGHRPETAEDAIFIVYLQSRTTFFQITDVFSFANQSLKARDGKQNTFAHLRFSRDSRLSQATSVQCQALKRLLDATGHNHWLYTVPSWPLGSGVYCEQQGESDTSTLLPFPTSKGHNKKIHPHNLSRQDLCQGRSVFKFNNCNRVPLIWLLPFFWKMRFLIGQRIRNASMSLQTRQFQLMTFSATSMTKLNNVWKNPSLLVSPHNGLFIKC